VVAARYSTSKPAMHAVFNEQLPVVVAVVVMTVGVTAGVLARAVLLDRFTVSVAR